MDGPHQHGLVSSAGVANFPSCLSRVAPHCVSRCLYHLPSIGPGASFRSVGVHSLLRGPQHSVLRTLARDGGLLLVGSTAPTLSHATSHFHDWPNDLYWAAGPGPLDHGGLLVTVLVALYAVKWHYWSPASSRPGPCSLLLLVTWPAMAQHSSANDTHAFCNNRASRARSALFRLPPRCGCPWLLLLPRNHWQSRLRGHCGRIAAVTVTVAQAP
jgi:hypothetical protein